MILASLFFATMSVCIKFASAHFIVATLHQGFAARVHALGNFVVFDAGFHVGRFLGFYKFAFKGHDFFGVEKLHHVQSLFGADGVQG